MNTQRCLVTARLPVSVGRLAQAIANLHNGQIRSSLDYVLAAGVLLYAEASPDQQCRYLTRATCAMVIEDAQSLDCPALRTAADTLAALGHVPTPEQAVAFQRAAGDGQEMDRVARLVDGGGWRRAA
jgi:hypothetical protein